MKDRFFKEIQGDSVFIEALREIVRRVAQAADPERIVIFGSAAAGHYTSDSDIDLLVVKKCTHRREVAGRIYRSLIGVGRAVDVVVVTPEDVRRYRHSPALVIHPALKEGKTVYAA